MHYLKKIKKDLDLNKPVSQKMTSEKLGELIKRLNKSVYFEEDYEFVTEGIASVIYYLNKSDLNPEISQKLKNIFIEISDFFPYHHLIKRVTRSKRVTRR